MVIKCLCVDDSVMMRRIVVNTLRSLGITDVVEASNGKEALTRWDSGINLVITDWTMPVMGGLELVRELRKKANHSELPILMITTVSVKEDVLQAIDAGVTSYILKPFTPDYLKSRIDAILTDKPSPEPSAPSQSVPSAPPA